ncbi:MAG: L,D-transpeptidase [Armatimonadetes bacterium]|nr:hypothetical protein [Armatimonadota bacterium]NOG93479.1 L,D-transpeptidase [Armatimonadota bacterium]
MILAAVVLLFSAQEVPLPKPRPDPGLEPKVEKRIEVDIEAQMLRAFEGETLKFEFQCSTGRNNATPVGEWPIRQKRRYNRALPEYGSVPIPWSLCLDIVVNGRRKRIAIHAHKSVPRYPASHGCIRLKYSDAPKLFEWAEVGLVVKID